MNGSDFFNSRYGNSSPASATPIYTCQDVVETYHSTLLKSPYDVTENALFNTLFLMVSATGVFGNGLVVLVIIRNVAMRIPRNVLITNLAIADFLAAATIFPFVRLPQITQWQYGSWVCKFFNVFSGMNVFCSALTVMAIAVDRYIAVRSSRPQEASQKRPVILLSVLIWVMSLLFSLPVGFYYSIVDKSIDFKHIESALNVSIVCSIPGMTRVEIMYCSYAPPDDKTKVSLLILHTLFLLPIPFSCLTICNYLLHKFLQQQNERHRSLTSQQSNSIPKTMKHTSRLSVPEIGGPMGGRSRLGSTAISNNGDSTPNHSKHGDAASRASSNRHRRLSILLAAMALSHAFLWFPFTVFMWISDHQLLSGDVFRRLDIYFTILAYCSLAVNPFLYAYFNTNFNREFRYLFSCCCNRGERSGVPRATPSYAPTETQLHRTSAGTSNYNATSNNRNNAISDYSAYNNDSNYYSIRRKLSNTSNQTNLNGLEQNLEPITPKNSSSPLIDAESYFPTSASYPKLNNPHTGSNINDNKHVNNANIIGKLSMACLSKNGGVTVEKLNEISLRHSSCHELRRSLKIDFIDGCGENSTAAARF